jgi:DNA-directed RNA polymerase I subunit RPA2
MERDALLAHGTSFLLQDRLMNCSDYSTAWVCRTCGSIISLAYDDVGLGTDIGFGKGDVGPRTGPNGEYCRICRAKEVQSGPGADQANGVRFTIGDGAQKLGSEGDMDIVAMPYVMKFLCAELASMGINLSLGVK